VSSMTSCARVCVSLYIKSTGIAAMFRQVS
jgi:hypothetical protein